ncbi:MAG: zf-TFIIB domain-containing protein [Pseudomonadales bacterium]|nr:zf-TFIIB domain-containing protein [Pseudomonadales bacterium]
MKCPKCGEAFEAVVFNDIEVERCLGCKGLWFDMLEKEDLVKMEGSEVIDIGSDQVGRKYNKIQEYDCPVCESHMIPMVDKDQFHIHYECCPACFGTFFDAGEFRDLKDHTVAERFSRMLSALRSHL